MATAVEEPRSPVLANVIVGAGFVVLFTTFATDSPWSWIIGGVMLLAGGVWAGARDGDAVPAETIAASADQTAAAGHAGGQRHGHAH